jgi:hypothetical protein
MYSINQESGTYMFCEKDWLKCETYFGLLRFPYEQDLLRNVCFRGASHYDMRRRISNWNLISACTANEISEPVQEANIVSAP